MSILIIVASVNGFCKELEFAEQFSCLNAPLFLAQCSATKQLLPRDIIADALIFSGCDAGTPLFSQSMERFERLLSSASTPEILRLPPMERANAVLVMIHELLLTQYCETESRLQELAIHGTFNCVSSGILYLAAARAAGLIVNGVGTTSHAFCSVLIDGNFFDVETTNRYGFNPGTKKEFHNSFGKTTGFTYVPAKNYAGRAQMTDRAFLAFILGNRSGIFCNRSDYLQGIPLAVARVEYVKNDGGIFYDQALQELQKVCINYVVTLQQKHRFVESLQFASAAISRYGFSSEWQKCLDSAVFNAVANSLNKNAVDDALQIFSEWKNLLPQSRSTELESMTFMGAVYRVTGGMAPAKKRVYLEKVCNEQPEAKNPRTWKLLVEMRESCWIQEAESHAVKKDFIKAALVIDAAIVQDGSNARFVKARKVYVRNYCGTIHNAFAALYNKNLFEDAAAVLTEGLQRFPDSTMLQQDLAAVQKKLSSDRGTQ